MGMFAEALQEKEGFDAPLDFEKESKQLQLGLSFEQTTGVSPDEHAEAMEMS